MNVAFSFFSPTGWRLAEARNARLRHWKRPLECAIFEPGVNIASDLICFTKGGCFFCLFVSKEISNVLPSIPAPEGDLVVINDKGSRYNKLLTSF